MQSNKLVDKIVSTLASFSCLIMIKRYAGRFDKKNQNGNTFEKQRYPTFCFNYNAKIILYMYMCIYEILVL